MRPRSKILETRPDARRGSARPTSAMLLTQRLRTRSSALLLSLLFVTLFISRASAQGLPQITASTNNAIPTASGPNSASATGATDAKSTGGSNTGSNTNANSGSTAAATATPTDSSSGGSSALTSTGAPPKISSAGEINSGAATESGGLPSGLPQIPGGFNYPAPSVPPTLNAPYMQKSNLPDGTVFIAVGAALGFLTLSVLAWRGLVAWSINRSVRRAAMQQSYGGDVKSSIRPRKKSGVYSQRPGSSVSLEKLGASGRTGTSHSAKGHTPNSSLFFSPTAGAGMHTAGNRNSGYLPAGYYAAGTSAPGGGAGMTHIGNGPAIGLTNLRPHSQGYSRPRSVGPSPPGSPGPPPSSRGADTTYGRLSNVGTSRHASTSSVNLSAPPQGRAPSAYLEDLFENHPPGSIPGGRPSMDRRY